MNTTTLTNMQGTRLSLSSALTGPPGPANVGGGAGVSADADNRTTLGGDGGIYTPDLIVDPLAYYILAKG